jgi:hypothetical protein
MTSPKQTYLERIRQETAYPTFRVLVRIIAICFYIAAVLMLLGTIFSGLNSIEDSTAVFMLAVRIVLSVVCAAVGKLTQEAASMVADIADSITDLNSRYEQ